MTSIERIHCPSSIYTFTECIRLPSNVPNAQTKRIHYSPKSAINLTTATNTALIFLPKNKFQPSNLIHQMCIPRVTPIPNPIPLQIQENCHQTFAISHSSNVNRSAHRSKNKNKKIKYTRERHKKKKTEISIHSIQYVPWPNVMAHPPNTHTHTLTERSSQQQWKCFLFLFRVSWLSSVPLLTDIMPNWPETDQKPMPIYIVISLCPAPKFWCLPIPSSAQPNQPYRPPPSPPPIPICSAALCCTAHMTDIFLSAVANHLLKV